MVLLRGYIESKKKKKRYSCLAVHVVLCVRVAKRFRFLFYQNSHRGKTETSQKEVACPYIQITKMGHTVLLM
jgi:hypothetical protein